MKPLFILFLSLISLNIRAEIIATYHFAENLASPQDKLHYVISKIELYENQSLNILNQFYESDDLSSFGARLVKAELKTLTINEHIYLKIFQGLKTLANTELDILNRRMVCEVFPSSLVRFNHLEVRRDYSNQTQKFEGELTLVLGPQGCWVQSQVAPSSLYVKVSATTIKTIFSTIVLSNI